MFIVKIPGINGLGKTLGCDLSGNELLKVLKEDIHSNESGTHLEFGKLDLEEIHLDNSDLNKTSKLVYKNSFEIFSLKPKTLFLGGDHSISYFTVKGFADYCADFGKEPCLIVFDAHPDCMPVTREFQSYPAHKEWLRALVEQGFPGKNILLVGVRNIDVAERDFIKEKEIKIIQMDRLLENIEETCEIIMEFSDKKELYVSLDIDVLDPVFAPATGYPEPGGLTSREIIYLLKRINKIKNLRGVDLVEINPKKDRDGITVKLGAKIIAELI